MFSPFNEMLQFRNPKSGLWALINQICAALDSHYVVLVISWRESSWLAHVVSLKDVGLLHPYRRNDPT